MAQAGRGLKFFIEYIGSTAIKSLRDISSTEHDGI